MKVKIIRSAAGTGWHVNENERLDLSDDWARNLISQGIAVPDGPETEAVTHTRNAMRSNPQLKRKG